MRECAETNILRLAFDGNLLASRQLRKNMNESKSRIHNVDIAEEKLFKTRETRNVRYAFCERQPAIIFGISRKERGRNALSERSLAGSSKTSSR